jgi:hypothetical protein
MLGRFNVILPSAGQNDKSGHWAKEKLQCVVRILCRLGH